MRDKDDFFNETIQRIPWASLDSDEDWFILDAKDTSKIKSNVLDWFKVQLLESAEFRAKVLEIVSE